MSIKRAFDLIFATLFLLLSLPLWILISCLIRLDSPGPIIISQVRLGKHRSPFKILKFRTIKNGHQGVKRAIIKGDECLTEFGKTLRTFHMDELPQLLNVLVGDMSLVGPRPQPEYELLRIETLFPSYKERMAVLPGLTGPVQVAGRDEYGIDGGSRAVSLDLEYVKNHSIRGDVRIIAKTIVVVLKRQGV